ncbi:TetR/AcrR family transcriptional regulator [Geothrix sp. PMB-07]|uniref:TetR/AcrR family transcriptional regulator n=1 Tax=Geothrix sp. PMB-07 TaxID=3068640 RepID=UPI0027405420|nr:TetR/AcrR family transcriptional regulator [Geothrix sp. PMB-07]WLT33265.1 TetR/AcrR family transcriptional regulator [Geothrix sp. PMB-07]
MPNAPAPRSRGPKPTKVDPNHLLDAAQAVFAQEGLQAASLRAIARKAGCDPALIYYHFENKEALFAALLQRRFPAMQMELERLVADETQSTAEQLWGVLRIYHRHLKDDPGIRSMIRGEIVRGGEGLGGLIEEQLRPIVLTVKGLFDRGIARGDLRPDLPPLLATFFLARMQLEILDLLPTVLPRLSGLSPETAVTTGMRAWFDLFWRGAAANPAAPLPTLSAPID